MRHRTGRLLFLMAYFSATFLAFRFSSPAAEISEKSIERLNKIIKVIKRYKDEGEDLKDPFVNGLILKEVSEFVPLTPEGTPKSVALDDLSNKIREKVALRFPDKHSDLLKKLQAEADGKFKMANINEWMNVKYSRGDKMYTVEGTFYGYGGNSVNIGSNILPIVDLLDDDRVKFDKSFNEKKKKEFQNQIIDNYYKRKQAYSSDVRSELLRHIYQENEKEGFILAYNKWRNAKEVTDILIDDFMKSSQSSQPSQSVEVTSNPAAEPEPAAPPPAEMTLTEIEKKKRELMKIAENQWVKITTTYAGIDADQGHRPAIWYMKGEDVNLVFPNELKPDDKSEIKVISFDKDNPIEKVELHFFNNYLFKVVTRFRLAKSKDEMNEIVKKIFDKYGPSDEEKQELEAEKLAAAGGAEGGDATSAPPPAEGAPVAPPPAEAAPPVEEIPREHVYTWTGSITKGRLTIKLDEARIGFTEFVLEKENPKVVQDVTETMNKEKKLKEDEDKKKELEIYKKFRNL